MPELPEVEITLRGITPHLWGTCFDHLLVWERRLRWPVPADTEHQVRGQLQCCASLKEDWLFLRSHAWHLAASRRAENQK